MTETQRTNLQARAIQVKSDKPKMPVQEMINRIYFLTGRDMSKCIEGYKLMRSEKMIEDEFVEDGLEMESALLTMLQKTEVSSMLDKFGCIFFKPEVMKKIKIIEVPKPKPQNTFTQVAERLNLQTDF